MAELHVDITSEATLVAALRLIRAQIAEKKELEQAIEDKLKGFLGDATEARIGSTRSSTTGGRSRGRPST
ncbi:hypothetical protein HFP72_06815 [Nocardiopsis sp. ARC36]